MNQLLLKNASILDVTDGTIIQGSILIKNGVIDSLFTGDDPLPEGAPGIDATGKWVIPGLIDMHVHIKEAFAPLFTAAGVTTVRNTGGNVLELERMRKAPATAPTPRVYSADRLIDGPPGLWGETSPWSVNMEDAEMARAEVRRQVEAGADFIKVYGWLREDVMTAVADEAKIHAKDVSCDLVHSTDVNALTAAAIGIRWNEHASGFVQAMYPEWSMQADRAVWDTIDWTTPDIERIRTICEPLIQAGVILCPTMTLIDQMNRASQPWQPADPVIEKMIENTDMIGQWTAIASQPEALHPHGRQAIMNRTIARHYAELGGTVVAGTDTPAGIFTFPGMALHRELELFIEAGFTELDAIRAATITAAQAIGWHTLGAVSPGYIADLVLLNSNPLETIENTRDIHLIIKGGQPWTQDALFEKIPTKEEAWQMYQAFVEAFRP